VPLECHVAKQRGCAQYKKRYICGTDVSCCSPISDDRRKVPHPCSVTRPCRAPAVRRRSLLQCAAGRIRVPKCAAADTALTAAGARGAEECCLSQGINEEEIDYTLYTLAQVTPPCTAAICRYVLPLPLCTAAMFSGVDEDKAVCACAASPK
jgi:hypothetical protein